MKELWRKKSVKVSLAVIVILVVLGIAGISAQSSQLRREYNGHIEAAEKYLSDLDYEQAIAEYTLALEIEPNAEEVLNALEQAYLDHAQSLADSGEYEKAVSVLENGYAQIGRESLREKIGQLEAQQRQWVVAEWNRVRDASVMIRSVKDMQHISDERLGSSIKELIPSIESLKDNGQNDSELWEANWYLALLYHWSGEYGSSSESFRQYWKDYQEAANNHEFKTESGHFIHVHVSDDGVRDEITYDQYGSIISRKLIFLEDGSFDEYIYEYNEKGNVIREISSGKRNSLQAVLTLDGSREADSYCSQDSSSSEYQYDELGRVAVFVHTSHYIFNDGRTGDSNFTSTFTYHGENKFTERRVEESFENGIKISDTEFSIDHEIINEYGEYAQTGEIYNLVNNYYR